MLPPVSLNLSAGEQVIFEGHPSWRAILGFYLKGVLIAVILGPLAEDSLRRALAVSEGDATVLVGSGITVVLYTLMIIAVVFSAVTKVRSRRRVDF